ncbi:MAG: hypothetical protein IJF80_07540 [Clostridia bacterium]|nr:hypothetical protein [Clostridia bacterium]
MKNNKKDKLSMKEELAEMGLPTEEIEESVSDKANPNEAEASIDDDLALQIGKAVINEFSAIGNMDVSSIAQLLLGNETDTSETGMAALSVKAANDLVRLEKEGKLSKDIESYISDPDFVKLLYDMPAHVAVRLYDAETKTSLGSDAEAIKKAEQSIIEKLLARKALPVSTKSKSSASPDTDYSNMSSAQFRELSKRLRKAANDGIKVRI